MDGRSVVELYCAETRPDGLNKAVPEVRCHDGRCRQVAAHDEVEIDNIRFERNGRLMSLAMSKGTLLSLPISGSRCRSAEMEPLTRSAWKMEFGLAPVSSTVKSRRRVETLGPTSLYILSLRFLIVRARYGSFSSQFFKDGRSRRCVSILCPVGEGLVRPFSSG